jgi:hypothetical protein
VNDFPDPFNLSRSKSIGTQQFPGLPVPKTIREPVGSIDRRDKRESNVAPAAGFQDEPRQIIVVKAVGIDDDPACFRIV